jgi:hypothetical protein
LTLATNGASWYFVIEGGELQDPLSEATKREMRMRERERAGDVAQAKAEQLDRENEAVHDWVQKRNFEEANQRSQRQESVAATAVEPELTEEFNWQWVDRRIAARLREEREYFNAALAEHARDTVEMIDAVINMVEDVLSKNAAKNHDGLTSALEKITKTLESNQRAIMKAVNGRVGDEFSKPEPPQAASRH